MVARDLAAFLVALQGQDTVGGPAPDASNFHRGGDLRRYDEEVHRALVILEGRIDDKHAMKVWNEAVATKWNHRAVWVHGDISPGNLLQRYGDLVAVIDFGNLAVGDPACDLAIAWTWFEGEAQASFRRQLRIDDETWLRGRAWALWKALVVAAGISPTNAIDYGDPIDVLRRCLE